MNQTITDSIQSHYLFVEGKKSDRSQCSFSIELMEEN